MAKCPNEYVDHHEHGEALPMHPCPYKMDVEDDEESLCPCCEKCMHECAQDI